MELPAQYIGPRRPPSELLAYQLRVLRVLARTEFKLKYAGSVLGYLWSLAKPLLYFGVLWVVFSHLFKSAVPHYSLYLLTGITIFGFVADSVTSSVPSIVQRGGVLRRISFPSLLIPLSITVTAAITFLLNVVVVAVFYAASTIRPRAEWFALFPLALELLAFALGLALIFSTLFVRYRDAGQIWEVLTTVLLFTSPIMYPISILPSWGREIVSFSPLVQIIQDSRHVLLGRDTGAGTLYMLAESRVFPILIAVATLILGLLLQRREAPRFPELA
jgi:ABC-2 type transport system permease protein